MTREHVEYVHHTELGWESSEVEGLPQDTQEKVLSEDPETGASTRMLKLTRERHDPVHDPLAWDHAVEILVLDGELWLGNRRLGRFDYAYVPSSASVPRFGAPDEATVLFMPDAALSVTDPDDSVDVDVKITGDMEWEGVSQYASADWTDVGAGIKILHQDEDTGEMSWILASLPQRTGLGVEVHPVVEEAYQLLGAIQGDRGLLDAGSYFWRPPDVPHGPFSNEIGSMTFFRTRGGPLETEYILETDEIE